MCYRFVGIIGLWLFIGGFNFDFFLIYALKLIVFIMIP